MNLPLAFVLFLVLKGFLAGVMIPFALQDFSRFSLARRFLIKIIFLVPSLSFLVFMGGVVVYGMNPYQTSEILPSLLVGAVTGRLLLRWVVRVRIARIKQVSP